jgi:acid phosphatase type 7
MKARKRALADGGDTQLIAMGPKVSASYTQRWRTAGRRREGDVGLRLAWPPVGVVVAVVVTVPIAVAASAGSRSGTSITLAVAGDIACPVGDGGVSPNGPSGQDNCEQAVTAGLVDKLKPTVVAAPGDLQYEEGSLADFLGSFDKSWGAFKRLLYPAPGNHEWYDSPNGQGYFDYFDGVGKQTGRAGPRGLGYYSVNLNRYWHLITLNSNCTSDDSRILTPVPCGRGSAQERWLRADLAAHRGMCLIAQWHHPLFTSGPNQGSPNDLATASFWHDLYAAHATLVLNGHDHGYERFAPQTDRGTLDRTHGIVEFVLGTGGKSLFAPGPKPAANREVYNDTSFGVTLFTLHPHSYQWHFYPADVPGNGSFTDQGTGPCNTGRG